MLFGATTGAPGSSLQAAWADVRTRSQELHRDTRHVLLEVNFIFLFYLELRFESKITVFFTPPGLKRNHFLVLAVKNVFMSIY